MAAVCAFGHWTSKWTTKPDGTINIPMPISVAISFRPWSTGRLFLLDISHPPFWTTSLSSRNLSLRPKHLTNRSIVFMRHNFTTDLNSEFATCRVKNCEADQPTPVGRSELHIFNLSTLTHQDIRPQFGP